MSRKRLSFAEAYPDLLKWWDFDKNTLDPYAIGPTSPKVAYWKCEHGHSFQRSVVTFTQGAHTCPVCQERKANVISKPELMKFWDFEKNTLDPETTRAQSEEYAWFKCPKCGYSWQAQIRGRLKKDKCPVCETNKIVHKGFNDFRTVYPQLALDTSDEMNPDIDLNSLGAGAHVRIHWKCHVCGFEWDAPVYGRIRRYKGNYKIASCPACAKNQRKNGYDVDYPELVPLYSPNNPIPFQDVRGYDTKLLWICTKHGEYEQYLRSMMRAVKNGNTGCPYCHGSQVHPDESFGVLHPELVKEWNESNEKTPYDYTEHSRYVATWHCPDCGTKWEADISTRAAGYGKCPNCYGSQTFKERYPELEQYYAKDNDLPFEEATVSDNTPRNWICEHGHEFEDSFNNIHKRGFRCPYCESVKVLQGFNDFATLEPEYAKDYDETLNGNTASDVLINNRPAYFKCNQGHSFVRNIVQHVALKGVCPVCNGYLLQTGVNDLATVYPQAAELWDYEKNDNTPDKVLATLGARYHYICKEGHHFKCTLGDLVKNDYKCPVCTGDRVDPQTTSILAVNPELAKEFSEANDVTADFVSYNTERKVYWTCQTCGGDYLYPVNKRQIGDNSCPYCNHVRLKTGINDLTITNPELAKEWASTNTKQANEVGEWQSYVGYWLCPDCGTVYPCEVRNRSVGDDSCPVCANKQVKKGFNDLATLDPELADMLSPNCERKADEILRTCSYEALWTCPECAGEYRRPVKTKAHDNSDCPYCNGRKVLTGYNDLATTNPELIPQYSSLNERPATMVRKDWRATAIWECSDCHYVYEKELRTKTPGNSDCPICSKRIAVEGWNSLQDEYPDLPFIWSDKNEKKTTDVTSQSSYKAIWVCPTCKHEFKAEVRRVVAGEIECPVCTGKVAIEGYNSFADEHPDIPYIWSEKNDKLPTEVTSISSYDAIWYCPTCKQEFRREVRRMASGSDKCPICTGRVAIEGYNSLLDEHPEIPFVWSEKNDKQITDVTSQSYYNAIWYCPKCKHEFKREVIEMVEGTKECPICTGKVAIAGYNSFADEHPELVPLWSINNDKKPTEVLSTGSYRALWVCPTCGDEYYGQVRDMVSGAVDCPVCNGRKAKAGVNSLQDCYPELMEEWCDVENLFLGLSPDEVLPTSREMVYWQCKDCGRKYQQTIAMRVEKFERGFVSCTYCSGRRPKETYRLL